MIERTLNRLKRSRRMAARHEKTAARYLTRLMIAMVCWSGSAFAHTP